MSLEQGSTAAAGTVLAVSGCPIEGRRTDVGGETGCGASVVCPRQL